MLNLLHQNIYFTICNRRYILKFFFSFLLSYQKRSNVSCVLCAGGRVDTQRSKVGEKWGELGGNVEGGAKQPVNMHRHVMFIYSSVRCSRNVESPHY